MKMKKTGWSRFAVPLVLVLAVAAGPTPVRAQDARVECRCVDRDGVEIERCQCLRSPRIEGLLSSIGFGGGRPRLGISLEASQSARYDADGVLVADVLEGGPADDAGIREGDVITRIDGQSLSEPIGASAEEEFDLDQSVPVQRLMALVREIEPGQEVEIEYLRGDELQTTTLAADDLSEAWGPGFSLMSPDFDAERFREGLRTLTDEARALRFRADPDLRGDPPLRFDTRDRNLSFFGPGGGRAMLGGSGFYRDGLELVEVNPELGSYFGASEGVLVVDVDRSSGLGLRAGDVIVRVGTRTVETPDRFRRILSSYGADEDIEFHILRDGSDTTVTGRLRY